MTAPAKPAPRVVRHPLTCTWDAQHQALYAYVRSTNVHSTKEIRATVIVDRDRRGKITGIEVIL